MGALTNADLPLGAQPLNNALETEKPETENFPIDDVHKEGNLEITNEKLTKLEKDKLDNDSSLQKSKLDHINESSIRDSQKIIENDLSTKIVEKLKSTENEKLQISSEKEKEFLKTFFRNSDMFKDESAEMPGKKTENANSESEKKNIKLAQDQSKVDRNTLINENQDSNIEEKKDQPIPSETKLPNIQQSSIIRTPMKNKNVDNDGSKILTDTEMENKDEEIEIINEIKIKEIPDLVESLQAKGTDEEREREGDEEMNIDEKNPQDLEEEKLVKTQAK